MHHILAMLVRFVPAPVRGAFGIVGVGRLPTSAEADGERGRVHLAVGGFDAVCQRGPGVGRGGGGDSCWAPVDRQRRRSAPGTGQAGGILWGNGRFRPITGVEF